MVDTWSIGDDERWTWVCFSLADSLEGLCLVGTHGDLGNIYVTVSRCHQTEILLTDTLALCSKLCNGTEWSRFRALTACIRVNLSIEYEDIYIFARSDNVVETAVTDVVRSTITTDNPL